jgi:hypothetical protein
MLTNRETPRGLLNDLGRVLALALAIPIVASLSVLPFALGGEAAGSYSQAADAAAKIPGDCVGSQAAQDLEDLEARPCRAVAYRWRSGWRDWIAEWSLPESWIQRAIQESNAAAADASRATDHADDLAYWSRIYAEAARLNRGRIEPFVRGFRALAERHNLSRRETLELVAAFAQHFEYAIPENYLQLYTPPRLLETGRGDCDSRSLFLVLVLERLEFDAVLLLSPRYRHAMAGVVCASCEGASLRTIDGRSYRFIETTARVPPGFLHPAVNDLAQWHALKLP